MVGGGGPRLQASMGCGMAECVRMVPGSAADALLTGFFRLLYPLLQSATLPGQVPAILPREVVFETGEQFEQPVDGDRPAAADMLHLPVPLRVVG